MNDNPVDITNSIKEKVRSAFGDNLKVTADDGINRDKGYYGVCYARPSNSVKASLSIDREILVLISTFQDQQVRTIQTAKSLIDESESRLDSGTAIIIHCDHRGNSKLKKWGREQGIAILPIYFKGTIPSGSELLRALAYELYSFDVFDVTGPVADDLQFFGRRDEARELAKKLQTGHIRSCFGIRKIGKTSILHRVLKEVRESYSCRTFLIDASIDAIFNLTAAKLINSIASTLISSEQHKSEGINIVLDDVDISEAAALLLAAIQQRSEQIIIIFDEIDYLTPTSPTAAHWRQEFNKFWRNLRAIYQAISARDRNLSIIVSGVSSKWFAEESIEGVENAALHFVPEEYLTPLPRGASTAMIRRLGKTAGLIFTEPVADLVAETCADMPFWIRKACSFVHDKVDIGLRPFELQKDFLEDYLREFITSDGTAMSKVALAHLFRVYPELREPALSCVRTNIVDLDNIVIRSLQKYGILTSGRFPAVNGRMMATGLSSYEGDNGNNRFELSNQISSEVNNYGDWADEIAILARRRGIIEWRVRDLVTNFIRFSSLSLAGSGNPKERMLKCVDGKRRAQLQSLPLDKLATGFIWLELIAVIRKEWVIFQKVFGDRAKLTSFSALVDETPSSLAATLDIEQIEQYRCALSWFEEQLDKN